MYRVSLKLEVKVWTVQLYLNTMYCIECSYMRGFTSCVLRALHGALRRHVLCLDWTKYELRLWGECMKKRGTKRASLQYQFIHSINKCFKEHTSKKSLKIQKRKGMMTSKEERAYDAKVWSYKYKENLIKFVKSFISWMKENGYYEEYKYAYELDGEIFTIYLRDLRLNRRNSYATMKTYESYIRKLQNIMNYTLPNYSFDFTSNLKPV